METLEKPTAKKRLSLDVFKEKSIGNEMNLDQTGGTTPISAPLCTWASPIFISMAGLLTGDTSPQQSGCHPAAQ